MHVKSAGIARIESPNWHPCQISFSVYQPCLSSYKEQPVFLPNDDFFQTTWQTPTSSNSKGFQTCKWQVGNRPMATWRGGEGDEGRRLLSLCRLAQNLKSFGEREGGRGRTRRFTNSPGTLRHFIPLPSSLPFSLSLSPLPPPLNFSSSGCQH